MADKLDASFEGKPIRSATNVQVVVRCRPSSSDERNRNVVETVHCDTLSNEVRVNPPAKSGVDKVFSFDRVFDPMSTQSQIYEEVVEPLVQQTLRGYNTTVLAYGQTGTGKTHTMEGEIEDMDGMGIIPRAMQSIFKSLEARGDSESFVKASYLEIYNENLMDLLSTTPPGELPPNQQLRIVEDKTKTGRGVIVHNLEEVLVKSWDDIRKVMKMAMAKRKVAATDLNDRSSRSHAVFTVTVHSKEFSAEGEELLRVGKINLVDLAGSECVARSGSKDIRAREAGNINQSLLTLGRVITALVERSPHIAYRDSKLTRLLQESLGGCSLTLMIATVAPSVHCLDETLSTLEYASRAKSIKNRPMANQKMSKKVALREYVEEIERLRVELQAARAKDGVFLPEDQYNQLVLQNRSNSMRNQDLEGLMEKRLSELNETRAYLTEKTSELRKTLMELDMERDRVAQTKDALSRKELELRDSMATAEERQAIIDAQSSTESRLHLAHDEYLDRLKIGKDRINGLHDKLDRKGQVERENDRMVNDLRVDLERNIQEVEQTLRDGKSISVERLTQVQECLEKLHKFVADETRIAHETFQSRSEDAFEATLDQIVRLNKERTSAEMSRVNKEGATNANEFGEAKKLFVEAARGHEEIIGLARRATTSETETLRGETVAVLSNAMELSRASQQAFGDALANSFSLLQGAVETLVDEFETRMEDMELQMRRMIGEEKQRNKIASDKTKDKIGFLLASLYDDSSYELDRILDQVHHTNVRAKELSHSELAGVQQTFALLEHTNANWFMSESDKSKIAIREATLADETAAHRAKVEWADLDERSQETVAIIRRGMTDCAASVSRVENTTQNTLAEVKARDQKHALEINSARIAWSEVSRAAQEEASAQEERGKQLLTSTKREVYSAKEYSESLCTGAISRLETSRERVERFALKEDRPTGRTPSRLQAFDWSKERPQTSPHSRIVDRVRRNKTTVSANLIAALGEVEDLGSSRNGSSILSTGVKRSLARFPSSASGSSENRDHNSSDSVSEDTVDLKGTELRSALKEKGFNVKSDKNIAKQRPKRASVEEIAEGEE